MDGNIRGVIVRRATLCLALSPLALSLVFTSGCKTTRNQPADPTPYQAPVQDHQGRSVSQFFGGTKPQNFVPQAPPTQVVHRDQSHRGKGLGAEGEVGIAVARFDAATMKTNTVERDQLLDAARQGFQRALKADPKNKDAYLGLTRLYTFVGDKENAVAMLQGAIKHHPQDHELYHRLAAVYFHFEDPAAARDAAQYALQFDPANRTYLKTLALCQAHLDDWQNAFGTLVGRNVMSEAEARYFLGRALIDLGRTDEGKAQIETAAQMDENYKLPRQFLTDLARGGPPKADDAVFTVGYDTPPPAEIK